MIYFVNQAVAGPLFKELFFAIGQDISFGLLRAIRNVLEQNKLTV